LWVAKDAEHGIIKSGGDIVVNTGASGAIPVSDHRRRNEHASRYYEEIRNRIGDIDAIAQNSGFSAQDVQKIKEHVFFNEYDLGENEPERFAPDYHMSLSWQRLIDGKSVEKMDIILLNHELMERDLMINKGLTYREAHALTEEKFNYSQLAKIKDEQSGGSHE
jgi:hypothetical protein